MRSSRVRSDGRGRVLVVVLVLGSLLVWAQGAVLQRHVLGSGGGVVDAGQLHVGAGVGLASAALLAVTMLVTRVGTSGRVGRAPAWLPTVLAIGVGTQLALAVAGWWRAGHADLVVDNGGGVGRGFLAGLLYPGSWLLLVGLVVVAVGAVRDARRRRRDGADPAADPAGDPATGTSSRERPAPPDR